MSADRSAAGRSVPIPISRLPISPQPHLARTAALLGREGGRIRRRSGLVRWSSRSWWPRRIGTLLRLAPLVHPLRGRRRRPQPKGVAGRVHGAHSATIRRRMWRFSCASSAASTGPEEWDVGENDSCCSSSLYTTSGGADNIIRHALHPKMEPGPQTPPYAPPTPGSAHGRVRPTKSVSAILRGASQNGVFPPSSSTIEV